MQGNPPKLKRVREETVEDQGVEGLQDGGHIYPACSNCRAILMDIFRTRPHETEVWKIQATCPFCPERNGKPERSFVVECHGGFHRGGYGEIKTDDPDEDVPSTIIDRYEYENETFVFITKKASPDAKPVYSRS